MSRAVTRVPGIVSYAHYAATIQDLSLCAAIIVVAEGFSDNNAKFSVTDAARKSMGELAQFISNGITVGI